MESKKEDTNKVAKFCYWGTNKNLTSLMPTNATEFMRNGDVPQNMWKQNKIKTKATGSWCEWLMAQGYQRGIMS